MRRDDDLSYVAGLILGRMCPKCEAFAWKCASTLQHEDIGGEDIETIRYRCLSCRHEWDAAEFDGEYASLLLGPNTN